MAYETSDYAGGGGSTLTAFFDSRTEAERAIERLRASGVPERSITLTGQDGGGSYESTRGEDRGFFEALGDFFFPDEDRHTYAEGLSRGGYLVTVREVSSELEDVVLDILDDEGAVDVDERAASWRSEGWTGYASAAGGSAGYEGRSAGFAEERSNFTAGSRDLGADETVPVVEESLRVGKRDAGHGRVRVRSYVYETPVSETVELADERVEVERRPVDRPVTGEDAFRERSIEAEEHTEEAVVSKEARVVEEVGLRKERGTREETVSETVRHTDVEIEDDRQADRQRR